MFGLRNDRAVTKIQEKVAGLDLFEMTREYLEKSFYDLFITFILYYICLCENVSKDISWCVRIQLAIQPYL